jgi:20S proteasome alpha/beta subunit
MTVGVGAICDGGKSVVVAADRMITFGAPMNLQTEPPDFNKITQITPRCALIFSGSGPDGEEIIASARKKLGGSPSPKTPITRVAEVVKEAYVELKRNRVEENILKPMLSATFKEFQTLCAQSSSSQVLQQVLGMIVQHNLNLEVMIAGVDESAVGAQLFVTTHPGQVFPMAMQGTTAIGSGGIHAAVRMTLGQHARTATIVDTVYNVYEAKRASEVAPGVGKLTDLAIITADTFRLANKPLFDILEAVHKEKPALSDDERGKLQGACNECMGKK